MAAPPHRLILAGLVALALALAGEAREADPPTDVRRWEYVLVVRTSTALPESVGRAEAAALSAGGAVLDRVRSTAAPGFTDWRMLVRTRERNAISGVVGEMRRVPGVMWTTLVPLPETPTLPGGPSFLSAYTAGLDGGTSTGIFVHRDVPPVLDKRDLLETVPVPVGPTDQLEGQLGGFSLNVSELLRRWKESWWRRREERMKNGELPILPEPDAQGAAEPSAP
jgi:hypothetical protein